MIGLHTKTDVLIDNKTSKIFGRNEGRIFLNIDILEKRNNQWETVTVLSMEEIRRIAEWYEKEKRNLV